ncbi:hypothetical protein DTI93_05535 [Parasaccharibacter sp. TMW 2.1884]|nr:hypothetical protein [Parasaccharibacter sp. TMW 2.1884]
MVFQKEIGHGSQEKPTVSVCGLILKSHFIQFLDDRNKLPSVNYFSSRPTQIDAQYLKLE